MGHDGREEAESAGPARLGQSACTPPDNRPIRGRGARGPEPIILGKGAEADYCSKGRCAARRCVRSPARPESPRSVPGLSGPTFPPRLGQRKPKAASAR